MWTLQCWMMIDFWLRDFPFNAFIRPLSIINSSVLNEDRFILERYPTLKICIWLCSRWLCSRVNSPVLIELGCVHKYCPTFTALIRPFLSVNSLMFCEDIFFFLKDFHSHCTSVGFLWCEISSVDWGGTDTSRIPYSMNSYGLSSMWICFCWLTCICSLRLFHIC